MAMLPMKQLWQIMKKINTTRLETEQQFMKTFETLSHYNFLNYPLKNDFKVVFKNRNLGQF